MAPIREVFLQLASWVSDRAPSSSIGPKRAMTNHLCLIVYFYVIYFGTVFRIPDGWVASRPGFS